MKSSPFKIALIYLVVGLCWVVGSNLLLAHLTGKHAGSIPIIMGEIIKGLVFIFITSFLLFLLILYYFRRLRNSWAAYHDLFGDNPAPMLAFDPDTLKILAVNNASLHLYGYTKKEFLAMTIDQLKPKEDLPRLLEVVRSGLSHFDKTKIQRHFTKNGKLLYVNVSAQNGSLNDKEVRWALIRDMTEVKENERLLKEAVERYELTMKATKDIIWDHIVNNGFIRLHGEVFEAFGYHTSSVDISWVREKIHPEDVQGVWSNVQQVIQTGLPYWSSQFRMGCADGSYKYVSARGNIIYAEDKKVTRSIGVLQVIQKEKEYELKIENQNKLLKEIAHTVSHSFRGPVASMKAMLSLIEQKGNVCPAIEQELQFLTRSADQLDEVIHEVMDKANKVYLE